jgi:peptidyl-prolyl cis-trans isomerase SurA
MLIHKKLKVVYMRRALSGLSIVAMLVGVGAAHTSAEVIQQVLLKVNGDIFTKTDLEERQVLLLRSRGFRPSDDAALQETLAEITPNLLVEVVDEMLIINRARELGYKMTDEDFTRVVTRIKDENKLDTDEAFQAALKQEGMTMDDLRESLERQMLIARIQNQEVMSKVGITEEEARKYHEAHLDQFTTPGAVTLREILIAVPKDERGTNVGLDDEAREKAEEARRRIEAGEAFEQVAAEVSTSPSRANGGLVGPLNPSELSQDLQDLLASMKPGEVSEVRRTAAGYQIIKLDTAEPERVLSAEEARDRIADALFQEKRQVEMEKYLAKLRSRAIIEWKNDELKKAYESALETRDKQAPAAEDPAAPVAPPEPTAATPGR